MLCSKCGKLNEPGSTRCVKCREKFPDRAASPPVLDEGLKQLMEAVESLKNREISSGKFRDLLEKMEFRFRKVMDEIGQVDIPDDFREEIKEEMNSGIGGIKLYLEAIKEMYLYLDDRNPLHLNHGIAMAVDANNRLNQALRLNFQTYSNLQETAEEFLRTQVQI